MSQFVQDFLKDQPWPSPLEKKKLRELLNDQLHFSKILDRVDGIVIQAVRENCDTSLVPLTRPIVKQFFPSETSNDEKDSKQVSKADEKKCSTREGTPSIRVESQLDKENTEQPQSGGSVSQDEAVAVSPETNVDCQNTAKRKEDMNHREVNSDELQTDKQDPVSSEVISPKSSVNDQEKGTEHGELVVESDDAVELDCIKESVHMPSSDTPDDNMEESTDVPVCESESPVSDLHRPMKRRRSSKSLMLEQSQDTISSRTRSKDSLPLKSTNLLPPKKRARKF